GDGTNAQVLGLGVLRDQPAPTGSYFYNNASPAATAGLLNSRQWTTTIPGVATVPTPDQGTIDSTFVESMVAQTRGERTPLLTPIASGVSDVRLYRVLAENGINNIHLAPLTVAPPEITVLGNSVSIADSDTTPSISDFTDFGSVTQGGAPVQHSFTVRNDGGSTLTISGLVLPSGFSLVEGLSSSIAANSSDTFTVQLDTTSTGTKSGQTRLANKRQGGDPFNSPDHGGGQPGGSAAGSNPAAPRRYHGRHDPARREHVAHRSGPIRDLRHRQ